MKISIAIILILLTVHVKSQEKEPVRKTFGVNLAVLPQNEKHENYLKKVGFIRRRCFKGFVLQSEFNVMFQQDPTALISNLKNGSYEIVNSTIFEKVDYSSSQRFFNTQLTLSKGWTNDVINLYVGAGLSISQSEMRSSFHKYQFTPQVDTLGNPYLHREDINESTHEVAKYMHVGIVVKASAEFKLAYKVSLLVQFSPEVSRAWRYETETPELSKVNYNMVTSSLIEVGIHYKL